MISGSQVHYNHIYEKCQVSSLEDAQRAGHWRPAERTPTHACVAPSVRAKASVPARDRGDGRRTVMAHYALAAGLECFNLFREHRPLGAQRVQLGRHSFCLEARSASSSDDTRFAWRKSPARSSSSKNGVLSWGIKLVGNTDLFLGPLLLIGRTRKDFGISTGLGISAVPLLHVQRELR